MGKISLRNIIITIICFAVSTMLVYWKPESQAAHKKMPLSQAVFKLESWRASNFSKLEGNIIDLLELDDYTNRGYFKGNDQIFLYIGYYLKTKKIGSAHDPLVCFPGQGWKLSQRSDGKIIIDPQEQLTVEYSSMVAELGERREYILYWFQSYNRTSGDTFSQKINSLWGKIIGGGEDNAFVRITMPLEGKSLTKANETVINFVREFYPVFLDYVKEGNETAKSNV
jgi:EpsI family protein